LNIILFGFKGSGKTYYGKKLALELGWNFIDTDELLGDPESLYREMGEELFRKKESEVIQNLRGVRETVIAVGGGAVLDPANVEALRQIGQLVYLDVPFEKLRITRTPAFAENKSLETIYNERKIVYEAIPALRINGI
jgi:shikimate kinase